MAQGTRPTTVRPMTDEQPAAAAPTGPPPSMFAIFRKRDFRFLWTGQLISTIGSSLTDLAAGILIFQRTNSALAVGLMLMATAIPSLFVGLVAGVFVDRFSRKKIMIASDLIRAGLVAEHPVPDPDRHPVPVPRRHPRELGQAVLRPGRAERPAGRRVGGGAVGGQRVPVDQLVRVDGDRVRGGGLPRLDGRHRDRVLRRRGDLRALGHLHRVRAGPADGRRGGDEREGGRREPLVRASACSSGRRSCARR